MVSVSAYILSDERTVANPLLGEGMGGSRMMSVDEQEVGSRGWVGLPN